MNTKADVASWFIPLAAALMLLGGLVFSSMGTVARSSIDAYHQDVRVAVDGLPRTIGPWVSEDVDPQPAAIKLLKPNVIMQRRYVHIDTGESIQLLIVHCGDTKDMIGHYPPQCYPSAGWEMHSRERVRLHYAGQPIDATKYQFSKFDPTAAQVVSLTVVNFFATPMGDGGLHPDMTGVNEMSRDRRIASLGAANIQLLSTQPLDLGPDSAAQRFIDEAAPAIDVILRGVADDQQPH